MSVIQPMYFSAGKYSAGTIRKHLSHLFKSNSDGTRIEGVIPSFDGTYALKVTQSSNLILSVNTGLCVISDKATQNLAADDADQPGFYISGIDDAPITVTLDSYVSARYDLIYAEVSETAFTVTNKVLSSNVATLTTSAAHGFVVGQTVVVSGVDETFDGQYVITAVGSTTTFSYARTASNVTSVAVTPYLQVGGVTKTISNKSLTSNVATITATSHGLTSSNVGDIISVRGVDTVFDGDYHIASVPTSSTITYKINRSPLANVASTAVSATGSTVATARVPFAIKIKKNATISPTLPSNTNSIPLALAYITSSSAVAITDYRKLVTSVNGVYIYDSTLTGVSQPTLPEGSLSYNTNTNTLQYYTAAAAAGSGTTISSLYAATTGGATTAASGTGTVATITTTSAHGLSVGDTVVVSGVTPTGYNGTFIVTAVPSTTQFSYLDSATGSQTIAGTVSVPYGTVSRSDHDHNIDGTTYLGISQVTTTGSSDTFVFPEGSSQTVLSANRTYMFDGILYLTITGAPYPAPVSLHWGSSENYTRVVGSFISYSRVETESVQYSGHFLDNTNIDYVSILPTTSGSTRYTVVKIKGFFVTGAIDVTIEPRVSSYGTAFLSGTTLSFYDVGDSSVTVINGTWT